MLVMGKKCDGNCFSCKHIDCILSDEDCAINEQKWGIEKATIELNQEIRREHSKSYKHRNPEKYKEYLEKNRDRLIEYQHRYYLDHRAERQEYQRKYYIEHKESALEYRRNRYLLLKKGGI